MSVISETESNLIITILFFQVLNIFFPRYESVVVFLTYQTRLSGKSETDKKNKVVKNYCFRWSYYSSLHYIHELIKIGE